MRPGVNNDIPRSPYKPYKNVFVAHVHDIKTEMRISQPNLQAWRPSGIFQLCPRKGYAESFLKALPERDSLWAFLTWSIEPVRRRPDVGWWGVAALSQEAPWDLEKRSVNVIGWLFLSSNRRNEMKQNGWIHRYEKHPDEQVEDTRCWNGNYPRPARWHRRRIRSRSRHTSRSDKTIKAWFHKDSLI